MTSAMVRGFKEFKDVLSPAINYAIKTIEEHYQKIGMQLRDEARKYLEIEKAEEVQELKDTWIFLQDNYAKDVDYERWFAAYRSAASALFLHKKYMESELKKVRIVSLREQKERIEEVLSKYFEDIPTDKYLLYHYFDENPLVV